jgi:hypothetical protein
MGVIIHRAVEAVIKAMGKVSVSTGEHRVVSAMKSLGGFTALLMNLTANVIRDVASNPRMAESDRDLPANLGQKLPQMRTSLQKLLRGIPHETEGHQMHSGSSPKTRESRPLRYGLNPEVLLQDKNSHWKGTADLIRVDPLGAEIIDFKTGEESRDHEEQVNLYAYLLAQDRLVNPSNIPVTRLTITYSDRSISSEPPTAEDLSKFIAGMTLRANSARKAVGNHPPIAVPRDDSCPICSVRQLCSTYWTEYLKTNLTAGARSAFVDAEVTLLKKRTSSTWEASVIACKDLPRGAEVMIRCNVETSLNAALLNSLTRARLLSAHLVPASEDVAMPTITLTRATEVFAIERNSH